MPLILDFVDRQAKLAYIQGQLKITEFYIQLWLARINSGFIQRDNNKDDSENLLNADAKIDKALNTVKQHIDNYRDLLDHQDQLIRGEV
jgi:hypothetical protein